MITIIFIYSYIFAIVISFIILIVVSDNQSVGNTVKCFFISLGGLMTLTAIISSAIENI